MIDKRSASAAQVLSWSAMLSGMGGLLGSASTSTISTKAIPRSIKLPNSSTSNVGISLVPQPVPLNRWIVRAGVGLKGRPVLSDSYPQRGRYQLLNQRVEGSSPSGL